MENFFKLKEHGTNTKTEFIAGLTTFFTMAYILVVNPLILGEAMMPAQGVFVATVLAAIIGTTFMGLFANVPYALAPGMGLNAFFAYTVVLGKGFTWEQALGMVFICGVINILITFTNLRKHIIKSIPESLQHAIGGGIGLFIAYIGLLNVKMVAFNNDIPSLAKFTNPTIIFTLIGLLITIALLVRKNKAALLIGILSVTVLAVAFAKITGDTSVVNLENFSFSAASYGTMFSEFKEVFGAVFRPEGLPSLFAHPETYGFIFMSIFSFSLTDTFDTIGTFIGTGRRSGIFSEEDEKALETGSGFSSRMDRALFADSIATSIGAILGTSNTTTFVESSAGIGAGGRTGLTSIFVSLFFLLSLFLGPLISIIPAAATAPALIMVGAMMTASFSDINWPDLDEAIPCFLTIVTMTVAYSVADGIAVGFISYCIIKIAKGEFKDLSPILIGSSLLFALNYVLVAFN